MRISDWSSDVCSSDLLLGFRHPEELGQQAARHLDHAHDAGGDLRGPDALRVAGRQKDLDGLRAVIQAHGKGANPSSARNALWRFFAFRISDSIVSSSACTALRSTSLSASAVLT